jgi:uncharacterized protein (DUF362 family)
MGDDLFVGVCTLNADGTVAIVKGNRERIIHDALSAIDVQSRVKPEDRVFIKPNFVRVPCTSPYAKVKGAYEPTISPEGDIVHRDALEQLLVALRAKGIHDITIGEASGGCETPVVYKALALYELAEEYGVRLVDLNYAESVKIRLPHGLALRYAWVPKILFYSDFTINLAALKVHGSTVVTLCLKNWGIGVPPGQYYGSNKAASRVAGLEGALPIHNRVKRLSENGQEVAVSKVLVDFCQACPPDLNVLDGFTVVDYEKVGLRKTRVREANLAFASYDIVAIDAAATRVMGFDPEKILHIKMAEEVGLGTADLSKLTILGDPIEDVAIRCNPRGVQRGVIRGGDRERHAPS